MSDELLLAFMWDALVFEALLPVLKHSVDAIKAWHKRLSIQAPVDNPGFAVTIPTVGQESEVPST